jgi:TRAF-type zinc finger/Zinc finger, C3HC4 type (RING finger)
MAENRTGRPQNPRSLSFEDVFDVITGTNNIPSLPRRSRSVRRDPLRTRRLEPLSSHISRLFSGSMEPVPAAGAPAASLDAVDLRQLEYVSHVYENLICTICVAVLVDPVQLPCEHIFCLECLGTHFQTIPGDTKTCPKCRRKVNMIADVARPPKIVREMVDDLVVRCPNGGCGAEVHRYTVQDHVSRYCGYTEVKCPEDNCGKKIERSRLAEGCLHGYEECDDCKELVMKRDLEVSVAMSPVMRRMLIKNTGA